MLASILYIGAQDFPLQGTLDLENMNLSGDYSYIDYIEGNSLLRVDKTGVFSVEGTVVSGSLDGNMSGNLWMFARVVDGEKITLSVDGETVVLPEQVTPGWICLGKRINSDHKVILTVLNNGGILDISRIYVLHAGFVPHYAEYLLDDLKAETMDDNTLKIHFSGKDITGNSVAVNRKMTVAGYTQYIKDKLGIFSEIAIATYLAQYFYTNSDISMGKVISGEDDFYVIDSEPVDNYESRYSLEVYRTLGENARSRGLVLTYDKESNTIETPDTNSFSDNVYAFNKNISNIGIEVTDGLLTPVNIGETLYNNENRSLETLPSFLNNSEYFRGSKDNEYVVFSANEYTDVYVGVTDSYTKNHSFYYDRDFILVRSRENGESYFYKRYGPGTGDSLYVGNRSLESTGDSIFSFVVNGDDLDIYLNIENTNLENSSSVVLSSIIQNGNSTDVKIPLVKTRDGLWALHIDNGAVNYKDEKSTFIFKDDNSENEISYIWNYSQYIADYGKGLSNIVYFSEVNKQFSRINFTNRRWDDNQGLEFWSTDNGDLFSDKNNGYSYGFVKENLIVKNQEEYEEDPSLKSSALFEGNRDNTWNMELEKGIYDISIVSEVKDDEENYSGYLKLNNNIYPLDSELNRRFEIRDSVYHNGGKLMLQNIGKKNLNIYSLEIAKPAGVIKQEEKIYSVSSPYSGGAYTEKLLDFDRENLFEVNYRKNSNLADTDGISRTTTLIITAQSDNNGILVINNSSQVTDQSILAKIKLTEEFKTYKIDISGVQETDIYLHGSKGTSFATDKHDLIPLKIITTIIPEEENIVFSGKGVVTNVLGEHVFTESDSGTKYNLGNLVDSELVGLDLWIEGIIIDEKLFIATFTILNTVEKVEGDLITNKSSAYLKLSSSKNPLQYIYGILNYRSYDYSSTGEISVPLKEEEGIQILETIPLFGQYMGLPLHTEIIHDITAPTINVSESIPEYTKDTSFEVSLNGQDNFTAPEELNYYYRPDVLTKDSEGNWVTALTGTAEELEIINGKAVIELSEGAFRLNFYTEDQAGNISSEYTKETVVDISAPDFDLEIRYENNGKVGVDKKQEIGFNFIKSDNFYSDTLIDTYYSINNGEFLTTKEFYIKKDLNSFPADGQYEIEAFAMDALGNKTDNIRKSFVVDTTPVELIPDYEVTVVDEKIVLSWTNLSDNSTFKHYVVRREPEFQNGEKEIILNDNVFREEYETYNTNHVYYIKSVDIYNNESPEIEAFAMKKKAVIGNVGETVNISFDEEAAGNSLAILIDEKTPVSIGVVKDETELAEKVKNQYGLIKDTIFHFGPEDTVFKEPAVWTIDLDKAALTEEQKAKKESLTIYYYNPLKKVWEEVETKYDSVNNRLQAKLHHFSLYGMGEKMENLLDFPKDKTRVSTVDGSLNAVIDLISLPSIKGDYELKLDFDSKRFNRKAELILPTSSGEKLYFKYYEDKSFYVRHRIELEMALNKNIWPKFHNVWSELDARATVKLKSNDSKVNKVETKHEIFDFTTLAGEINTVDLSWGINIPELLKSKPEHTNFKYLKFDDSSIYELKPTDGKYINNTGKMFVYREIKNNKNQTEYLVKTGNHKILYFNSKGKIVNISQVYDDLEKINTATLDAIKYFQFNYDEDSELSEIISYDNEGTEYGKLKFEYENILDSNDLLCAKRIVKIVKIVNNHEIGSTDLDYKNSQENRIRIYSRYNSTEKGIVFDYNLEKVVKNYSDSKKESVLLDYKADSKYMTMDINHDTFSGKDFEEYCESATFWCRCTDHPVETIPVPIKVYDKQVLNNQQISRLTELSIDNPDIKSTYYLKNKIEKDDYFYFNKDILSKCYQKKIEPKDKNTDTVIPDDKLNTYYFYKYNEEKNGLPYSKSLIINRQDEYSYTGSGLNVEQKPVYSFKESVNHEIYGVNETRTGIITEDMDLTNFEDLYLPVKVENELDKIAVITGFNRQNISTGTLNRAFQVTNYIQNVGQTGENILSKKRNDYYLNSSNIYKTYEYLGESVTRTTTYTYREGNRENDLLLNPQIESIEKQITDTETLLTTTNYKQNLKSQKYNPLMISVTDGTDYQYKHYEYDDMDRLTYEAASSEDHFNFEDPIGVMTKYVYDDLNRVIKTITSGETNIQEGDVSIKTDTKYLVETITYDILTGNKLAEATYESFDDDGSSFNKKAVVLFYYDYRGFNYKTVSFITGKDDEGNKITGPSTVTNQYINEFKEDKLYATGSYTRQEDAADYQTQFNYVIDNDTMSSEADTKDYVDYDKELTALKENNFDFNTTGDTVTFFTANQRIHYGGYVLRNEEYRKDFDTPAKPVIHRYLDSTVNRTGDILSKKNHTGVEVKYEYSLPGMVTKEEYPDDYKDDVTYSYDFSDYKTEITTTTDKYSEMTRKNRFGNVIYIEKDALNGGDEKFIENYGYNYQNQMTYKRGVEGAVENISYSLFGPQKKSIISKDGDKSLTTEFHHYNELGQEIYGFNNILINSTDTLDPAWAKTNWITEQQYDDFGQVIRIESKQDAAVFENAAEAAKNILTKKVYDMTGNVILEQSNLYEGDNTYEKLDRVKYEYEYDTQLKTKIYYAIDPANNTVIEYEESYTYDKYRRPEGSEIKRAGVLIEKTVITDYDYNQKAVVTFSKTEGKSWVKTTVEYNEDGKPLMTRIEILDDDSWTTSNFAAVDILQTNTKYIQYDKYDREIGVIDFDQSGKYILYNSKGQISEEYIIRSSKDYELDGSKLTVDKDQLIDPVIYEYNEAGLTTRVYQKNQNDEYLSDIAYEYDKYGRQTSETIDRYENETAKKSYTHYDSIGRVYKTVTDDITTEIKQWPEDSGNTKTVETIITNSRGSILYQSWDDKEIYSTHGNIIESIDRDNYKYKDTINRFGQTVLSTKHLESKLISKVGYIYDSSGQYVLEELIESDLGDDRNISYDDKKISYAYTNLGQIETVSTRDVDDTLITEKTYIYTDAGEIHTESLKIEGETDPYKIIYNYNNAGNLTSKTYPDDKVYVIDYNKDDDKGRMSGVNFDDNPILKKIEYNTNIIESYITEDDIKTTFGFDSALRIKSKTFTDTITEDEFNQIYSYDIAGNITEVKEGTKGSLTIIENTFNREFKYDTFNRLKEAEYTGSFKYKINEMLTLKTNDYFPSAVSIEKDDLTNNGETLVNLEQKASSIIISNSNNNETLLPAEIILQKSIETKIFSHDQINLYREENNTYQELTRDEHYTLEDTDSHYIIKSKNNSLKASNRYKINLDINDTDIYGNSVVERGTERKLNEHLSYSEQADGLEIYYTYDYFGNRETRVESVLQNGKSLETKDNTYTYKALKRQLDTDGEFKYEYDDDGYLISKTSLDGTLIWSYLWDAAGNLVEVNKAENGIETYAETHIYDEAGTKVKTIKPTATIVSIYENNDLIYEKTKENGIEIEKDLIYALGELQAVIETVDGEEETQYSHSDILGSTRFVRDNKKTLQETLCSPFGRELLNGVNDGGKVHYQWASHDPVNDKTGLQYHGARWMDQSSGRYVSPDPAKQGINWYIYAGNNPTTMIDPDGLMFGFDTWFGGSKTYGKYNPAMSSSYNWYWGNGAIIDHNDFYDTLNRSLYIENIFTSLSSNPIYNPTDLRYRKKPEKSNETLNYEVQDFDVRNYQTEMDSIERNGEEEPLNAWNPIEVNLGSASKGRSVTNTKWFGVYLDTMILNREGEKDQPNTGGISLGLYSTTTWSDEKGYLDCTEDIGLFFTYGGGYTSSNGPALGFIFGGSRKPVDILFSGDSVNYSVDVGPFEPVLILDKDMKKLNGGELRIGVSLDSFYNTPKLKRYRLLKHIPYVPISVSVTQEQSWHLSIPSLIKSCYEKNKEVVREIVKASLQFR